MDPEYVLFIDDNFEPLKPVLDTAAKAKGLQILYSSSVADGMVELERNSESITAVILDLLFAGQSTQGADALKELRNRYANIPVVVLTDNFDNIEVAINCIKNGAYDYLGKRHLDPTHLFHVLGNATGQSKLVKRIQQKAKIAVGLNPPAISFHKDDKLCRFAFKLNSISMQMDSGLLDNLIKASARWHYNLLHIIVSSFRECVLPSLVLIKHQKKSEVEIYLIFTLYDSNEETLKALSDEFIAAIEPFVLSLHESVTRPYVIDAVTDADTLNNLLYPKFHNSASRLYSEPTFWGNHGDYNLDMSDESEAVTAEFLPKLFSNELYSNYNLLTQSLLASTGTSYICAHLQPLRLRVNEKDFLKKVIDKETLPPEEIPEEAVSDYLSNFKDIISWPNENYLFEVRFLSDTHSGIPRPLDIEIKRHFYADGAIVKSTMQKGLFDNLFSIDKNINLGRLSFVKRAKEINWLFRLPEPTAKPIKGLPYQNASNQILPTNLSSTGLLLGEKVMGVMTSPIRIDAESLKKHLYVLGQTGTGKTTLLKSMIGDALNTNHGFCVIDPHGDLIEDVEKMIPASRRNDVVLFDTTNLQKSAKLNLLAPEVTVKQTMLMDELVRILAFEYDYKQIGGPIFETYFKATINLVMQPGVIKKYGTPTLQLAYKALLIPDFLKHLLSIVESNNITESQALDFSSSDIGSSELEYLFKTALKSSGDYDWNNMGPYIYSKLKFFVDNDYIRELFDSKQPTLNFRNIMDNGKILLVRLDKGHIGTSNLAKIGMLFLNKLIFSIMTRTDLPADKRRDFFVFIDEFQNLMRGDIGSALSEVRKYNVGIILANQTIGQLDDYLLQSILGNVGSTAFFRTGINDIGKIIHFIEPDFTAKELINLQNFNCIGRIMHNNRPSEPFVFQTI